MPKIVKETPPKNLLIECPITSPRPWMLQRACQCAALGSANVRALAEQGIEAKIGEPCPFFGGLIDGVDQIMARLAQKAKRQRLSEPESIAFIQEQIMCIEFHERFRVVCQSPTMRPMKPIAGEEG